MDEFEEINDENTVDDLNYKKLHDKLTKVGYADGITNGRDSVFQNGFDQGYSDGLKTGLQLEAVKSFYTNLDMGKIDAALTEEKETYNTLGIEETTSRQHFKYLECKDEVLQKVSARQQEYCDYLRCKFSEQLPKTMELLNHMYK